jgi:hypothetical protein
VVERVFLISKLSRVFTSFFFEDQRRWQEREQDGQIHTNDSVANKIFVALPRSGYTRIIIATLSTHGASGKQIISMDFVLDSEGIRHRR